jgi:two-component system osmolarity sensor histidine kinase EnvZ
MIKKILPKSLLGRTLLIIVTPLVLLQLVSATVFYESHWRKVSRSMARSLSGDISALIELLRQDHSPQGITAIRELAANNMGLVVSLEKNKILANVPEKKTVSIVDKMFVRSLKKSVQRPFKIDNKSLDNHLIVSIQLHEGVLEVILNRKRLFSSTTYIFVLWMVGTSMILFGVATIFMRNQVKPIRRLAAAADELGKGRDAPNLKPEGAREIRQAAAAFIAMRDRIQRQITQRTDMLAGVSHDLRTPLTRMKLQLEMVKDSSDTADLKDDVAEMEHMVEGYLAFARGEGYETPKPTNIAEILGDVAVLAKRRGAAVDFHTEGQFVVRVRQNAFKRCINNLLDNADRHATHVSIRTGKRGDAIEITVDDDGPGIPKHLRDEVFKPFFRLDESRNPETGGVGLGLTIARDIIRGHGGDIILSDSPSGGLRARLTLPI